MIRAWPMLALLLPLAAAACANDSTSPTAGCERQVYNDPEVKSLLMKSAGTESFRWDYAPLLDYAKKQALTRCLRERGLAPPGGVQSPPPGNRGIL
jgi:hypothetical protein